MSECKLLSGKKQFEEAQKLVNEVFDCDKRLPEQIFNKPLQKKYVLDFDRAMGYSFWQELQRLVSLSDDLYILMAVLDPHPVDYFYKEFSRYNWCIFSRDTTPDEYWNAIESSPEGSPADAIVSNSEVVIWLAPSLKWAIWGERSYGICVLGVSDDIGDYESKSWFTMDKAITDLVSLNFRNYTVPEEVISKLLKHFSNIT